MQLGIHVINPPGADPAATLRASAEAAEALGYRTLWIGDRLVGGGAQRIDRPTGPLDALATLAYAAAITERVRLGTSVLAGAWYRPALLARSLATVDQLSRGRLTVGVGASRSAEDSMAAAVPAVEEAATLASTLEALASTWQAIPPTAGPAPVQRPRPPLLVAADAPMAEALVARHADGWVADVPAGSVEELADRWARARAAADEAGRDGDALVLVAQVEVGAEADRAELVARIGQLGALGATEVILAGSPSATLDEALASYAAVAESIELRALA